MKKLVIVPHTDQGPRKQKRKLAKGQDVYIGVDVSRAKWVYKVRWDGQEQHGLSTPGQLKHLQALVGNYSGSKVHVVYEACGFGYEIAWWCQKQGIDVLVVAPSTVEQPPGRKVKTDPLDAGKLARELEQGRLKGVRVPSREQHAHRQLSRGYAQAVKERKRAQARVRSLMQEHGRIGPTPQQGWNTYRQWLDAQSLPEPVALSVEELLCLHEAAAASAKRLRSALTVVGCQPPYATIVRRLQQQAGVGELTAIRLVLELGDIRRFVTAGSFPRYLGLTPSEYSSGDSERRGHLIKCGPGFIRGWLIQCAWASIHKGRDPELRAVFDRLAPRVGRKRAIVAVARRLALRLRARWLEVLETEAA